MLVRERFQLNKKLLEKLSKIKIEWGYNGFSEAVFYRTYSRLIKLTNGQSKQENWLDVVKRVTEGTFSIRKDHYKKNHIEWNEKYWQEYSEQFTEYFYRMKWLPPGRGLWAMGTDFVYEQGSMALNNCGHVRIEDNIGECIEWLMDALMLGVGVGFEPVRNNDLKVYEPKGYFDYVIPDSREGWIESVRLLIDSYLIKNRKSPRFDYEEIRLAGEPIKRFGGISSGPEPLKILHDQIIYFFIMYLRCQNGETSNYYDSVLLKTDLANAVGCCVVAGNVRRSAELCQLNINDSIFLDLKNRDVFPYREQWMWMSNNSAILNEDKDFEQLGKIAKRVIRNGEPGIINLRNMKYGRIGQIKDKKKFGIREDDATGFNPCGEQCLESFELCTLVQTCPTHCDSPEEWLKACEYATFYASTVTLLPTHSSKTNRVMQKNRRIGVSIIDFIGMKHNYGTNQTIKYLREGYKRIRETNKLLNGEAGVPESIRVTTMQPGGTTPRIVSRRSGAGYANFKYMIRRMRVAQNSPMYAVLDNAGYPHEPDEYSANTEVFEFPVGPYDDAKVIDQVSLWEQAMNLILLQREWSDNAVSNTLNFRPKWNLTNKNATFEEFYKLFPEQQLLKFDGKEYIESEYLTRHHKAKVTTIVHSENELGYNIQIWTYDPRHEEDDIETVLSMIAPQIKSASLLPHTHKGVYAQMPEEGISEEEYNERLSKIEPIDWSTFNGSDGQDEKYCTGATCEVG